MKKDNIFLSPLENAAASLVDILKQPMDEYRRDGVIQRFGYTFELSWKLLQRVLEIEGIVVGSPKQVLQAAFKSGWIEDLEQWFIFLKARNLSVHTYNQKVADEVFEQAKNFPSFVLKLLETVKQQ